MEEIYLVGGTTARTDLDNYVSANISEENAIASMRRWQDYQGSYEDYHIDHIEIDDMAEHDTELLDKVAEKMKAEVNICKNCMAVDCDTEYFKPMCEKAEPSYYAEEMNEIIDRIVSELKEEVENEM